MSSTPHDLHDALTGGLAYRTGEFRYDVATDTWWWADEVYRMHGFEPGDLVPTTAMILAHKHPEDRERYAGALASTSLHGGFFGSVHRIIDAVGGERVLAAIGEARHADDGTVVDIGGHFVDVTASVHRLAGTLATAQIRAADEHRAVIDQAAGVLLGHTRCTPQDALRTLREASMTANVKLRDLAREVVEAAVSGDTAFLDRLVAPQQPDHGVRSDTIDPADGGTLDVRPSRRTAKNSP